MRWLVLVLGLLLSTVAFAADQVEPVGEELSPWQAPQPEPPPLPAPQQQPGTPLPHYKATRLPGQLLYTGLGLSALGMLGALGFSLYGLPISAINGVFGPSLLGLGISGAIGLSGIALMYVASDMTARLLPSIGRRTLVPRVLSPALAVTGIALGALSAHLFVQGFGYGDPSAMVGGFFSAFAATACFGAATATGIIGGVVTLYKVRAQLKRARTTTVLVPTLFREGGGLALAGTF